MTEKTKALTSAIVLIIVTAGGIFGVAIDESLATSIVGVVLIVASLAYGIWKNHNFTDAADVAEVLLKAIKGEAGQETIEYLQNIVDHLKEKNEAKTEGETSEVQNQEE